MNNFAIRHGAPDLLGYPVQGPRQFVGLECRHEFIGTGGGGPRDEGLNFPLTPVDCEVLSEKGHYLPRGPKDFIEG